VVERFVRELRPKCGVALRLTALLHDAAEYVIGDLISPFKTAIGLDYKAFENRLSSAIHVRFGLPADAPSADVVLIKQADRISAYFEATQLAGFTREEAESFFGTPKGVSPPRLVPLPAPDAEAAYLDRFRRLSAAL